MDASGLTFCELVQFLLSILICYLKFDIDKVSSSKILISHAPKSMLKEAARTMHHYVGFMSARILIKRYSPYDYWEVSNNHVAFSNHRVLNYSYDPNGKFAYQVSDTLISKKIFNCGDNIKSNGSIVSFITAAKVLGKNYLYPISTFKHSRGRISGVTSVTIKKQTLPIIYGGSEFRDKSSLMAFIDTHDDFDSMERHITLWYCFDGSSRIVVSNGFGVEIEHLYFDEPLIDYICGPCSDVSIKLPCIRGNYTNGHFIGELSCHRRASKKWKINCGNCVGARVRQHTVGARFGGQYTDYNCGIWKNELPWTKCEDQVSSLIKNNITAEYSMCGGKYYKVLKATYKNKEIQFRYDDTYECYVGKFAGRFVMLPTHVFNRKGMRDMDLAFLQMDRNDILSRHGINISADKFVRVNGRDYEVESNLVMKHLNGSTESYSNCFKDNSTALISGMPILQEGNLVSVVTCSGKFGNDTYYSLGNETSGIDMIHVNPVTYHSNRGRGRGTKKVFTPAAGVSTANSHQIAFVDMKIKNLAELSERLKVVDAKIRELQQEKINLQREIGALNSQISSVRANTRGRRRGGMSASSSWFFVVAIFFLLFSVISAAGLKTSINVKANTVTAPPSIIFENVSNPYGEHVELEDTPASRLAWFNEDARTLRARVNGLSFRMKRTISTINAKPNIGGHDGKNFCEASEYVFDDEWSPSKCMTETKCVKDSDKYFLAPAGDLCAFGWSDMVVGENNELISFRGTRKNRCSLKCLADSVLTDLIEAQTNATACICPILYALSGQRYIVKTSDNAEGGPKVIIYRDAVSVLMNGKDFSVIHRYQGDTPCRWGLSNRDEFSDKLGKFSCRSPPKIMDVGRKISRVTSSVQFSNWLNFGLSLAIVYCFSLINRPLLGTFTAGLVFIYYPVFGDQCVISGMVDLVDEIGDNTTHKTYSGKFNVRVGDCIKIGPQVTMTISEITHLKSYLSEGHIPLSIEKTCDRLDWNCPMTHSTACQSPSITCKDACKAKNQFYFEYCGSVKTWSGSECFRSGATNVHSDVCLQLGDKSTEYFQLFSVTESVEQFKMGVTIERAGHANKYILTSEDLNVGTDMLIESMHIVPGYFSTYSQIAHNDGKFSCSMFSTYPDKFCPGKLTENNTKFTPQSESCLAPKWMWRDDHFSVSYDQWSGASFFSRSFYKCSSHVRPQKVAETYGDSIIFEYDVDGAYMDLRATVPISHVTWTSCTNIENLSASVTPGYKDYYGYTLMVVVANFTTPPCLVKLDVDVCSVYGSSERVVKDTRASLSYKILCGFRSPSKIELVGLNVRKIITVKGTFSRDVDYAVSGVYRSFSTYAANATSAISDWFTGWGVDFYGWYETITSWFHVGKITSIILAIVVAYFALKALTSGAFYLAALFFGVGCFMFIPAIMGSPVEMTHDGVNFGLRLFDWISYYSIIANEYTLETLISYSWTVYTSYKLSSNWTEFVLVLYMILVLTDVSLSEKIESLLRDVRRRRRTEAYRHGIITNFLPLIFPIRSRYVNTHSIHSLGSGYFKPQHSIYTSANMDRKVNKSSIELALALGRLRGQCQLYLYNNFMKYSELLDGVYLCKHQLNDRIYNQFVVQHIAFDIAFVSEKYQPRARSHYHKGVRQFTNKNINTINIVTAENDEQLTYCIGQNHSIRWHFKGKTHDTLEGLSGCFITTRTNSFIQSQASRKNKHISQGSRSMRIFTSDLNTEQQSPYNEYLWLPVDKKKGLENRKRINVTIESATRVCHLVKNASEEKDLPKTNKDVFYTVDSIAYTKDGSSFLFETLTTLFSLTSNMSRVLFVVDNDIEDIQELSYMLAYFCEKKGLGYGLLTRFDYASVYASESSSIEICSLPSTSKSISVASVRSDSTISSLAIIEKKKKPISPKKYPVPTIEPPAKIWVTKPKKPKQQKRTSAAKDTTASGSALTIEELRDILTTDDVEKCVVELTEQCQDHSEKMNVAIEALTARDVVRYGNDSEYLFRELEGSQCLSYALALMEKKFGRDDAETAMRELILRFKEGYSLGHHSWLTMQLVISAIHFYELTETNPKLVEPFLKLDEQIADQLTSVFATEMSAIANKYCKEGYFDNDDEDEGESELVRVVTTGILETDAYQSLPSRVRKDLINTFDLFEIDPSEDINTVSASAKIYKMLGELYVIDEVETSSSTSDDERIIEAPSSVSSVIDDSIRDSLKLTESGNFANRIHFVIDFDSNILNPTFTVKIQQHPDEESDLKARVVILNNDPIEELVRNLAMISVGYKSAIYMEPQVYLEYDFTKVISINTNYNQQDINIYVIDDDVGHMASVVRHIETITPKRAWNSNAEAWRMLSQSGVMQSSSTTFDYRKFDGSTALGFDWLRENTIFSGRMSWLSGVGSITGGSDWAVTNYHCSRGNDIYMGKHDGQYQRGVVYKNPRNDPRNDTSLYGPIELAVATAGHYYALNSMVDKKTYFFQCVEVKGKFDDEVDHHVLFKPVKMDFENRTANVDLEWVRKPGLSGTTFIGVDGQCYGIYGVRKSYKVQGEVHSVYISKVPEKLDDLAAYFRDAANEVVTQQLAIEQKYFILEAPTGTGKTTRFTIEMWKRAYNHPNRRVLLLQPTRAACLNAYSNMVSALADLGSDYRVSLSMGGHENQHEGTGLTALEVMTYGKFLASIGPSFDKKMLDYSCVIFDEIHMRSDITILETHARILACQKLGNRWKHGPLAILVTATDINFQQFGRRLNGTRALSGERFTIEKVLAPNVVRADAGSILIDCKVLGIKELEQRKIQIPKVDLETQRSLFFVHSINAANNLAEYLQDKVNVPVYPYYANCGLDTTKLANPCIICSTDALGVSVTISDVHIVVDFGYEVKPEYSYTMLGNSSIYEAKMKTRLITEQTHKQRVGRTGRTCAGTVYRLFEHDVDTDPWKMSDCIPMTFAAASRDIPNFPKFMSTIYDKHLQMVLTQIWDWMRPLDAKHAEKMTACRNLQRDPVGLYLRRYISQEWLSIQQSTHIKHEFLQHCQTTHENQTWLKEYEKHFDSTTVLDTEDAVDIAMKHEGKIVNSEINEIRASVIRDKFLLDMLAITCAVKSQTVELFQSKLIRKGKSKKQLTEDERKAERENRDRKKLDRIFKVEEPAESELSTASSSEENAFVIYSGVIASFAAFIAANIGINGIMTSYCDRYVVKADFCQQVDLPQVLANLPLFEKEDQVVENTITDIWNKVCNWLVQKYKSFKQMFGKFGVRHEASPTEIQHLIGILTERTLLMYNTLGAAATIGAASFSGGIGIWFDNLAMSIGRTGAIALCSITSTLITWLGGPLIGVASVLISTLGYIFRNAITSTTDYQRYKILDQNWGNNGLGLLVGGALGVGAGFLYSPMITAMFLQAKEASSHSGLQQYLDQANRGLSPRLSNGGIVSSARHLYKFFLQFFTDGPKMSTQGSLATMFSIVQNFNGASVTQVAAITALCITLVLGRVCVKNFVKEDLKQTASVKITDGYADIKNGFVDLDMPEKFDLLVDVIATVANPWSLVPILLKTSQDAWLGIDVKDAFTGAFRNYAGVNLTAGMLPIIWDLIAGSFKAHQGTAQLESMSLFTTILSTISSITSVAWIALQWEKIKKCLGISKENELEMGSTMSFSPETPPAINDIRKKLNTLLRDSKHPLYGLMVKCKNMIDKTMISQEELGDLTDYVNAGGSNSITEVVTPIEVFEVIEEMKPAKCIFKKAWNALKNTIRWVWQKLLSAVNWIVNLASRCGKSLMRKAGLMVGEQVAVEVKKMLPFSQKDPIIIAESAAGMVPISVNGEHQIQNIRDALEQKRSLGIGGDDINIILGNMKTVLAQVGDENDWNKTSTSSMCTFAIETTMPLDTFKITGQAVNELLSGLLPVIGVTDSRCTLKMERGSINYFVEWSTDWVHLQINFFSTDINIFGKRTGNGCDIAGVITGITSKVVKAKLTDVLTVLLPPGLCNFNFDAQVDVLNIIMAIDVDSIRSAATKWWHRCLADENTIFGTLKRVGGDVMNKAAARFVRQQVNYVRDLVMTNQTFKMYLLSKEQKYRQWYVDHQRFYVDHFRGKVGVSTVENWFEILRDHFDRGVVLPTTHPHMPSTLREWRPFHLNRGYERLSAHEDTFLSVQSIRGKGPLLAQHMVYEQYGHKIWGRDAQGRADADWLARLGYDVTFLDNTGHYTYSHLPTCECHFVVDCAAIMCSVKTCSKHKLAKKLGPEDMDRWKAEVMNRLSCKSTEISDKLGHRSQESSWSVRFLQTVFKPQEKCSVLIHGMDASTEVRLPISVIETPVKSQVARETFFVTSEGLYGTLNTASYIFGGIMLALILQLVRGVSAFIQWDRWKNGEKIIQANIEALERAAVRPKAAKTPSKASRQQGFEGEDGTTTQDQLLREGEDETTTQERLLKEDEDEFFSKMLEATSGICCLSGPRISWIKSVVDAIDRLFFH